MHDSFSPHLEDNTPGAWSKEMFRGNTCKKMETITFSTQPAAHVPLSTCICAQCIPTCTGSHHSPAHSERLTD